MFNLLIINIIHFIGAWFLITSKLVSVFTSDGLRHGEFENLV